MSNWPYDDDDERANQMRIDYNRQRDREQGIARPSVRQCRTCERVYTEPDNREELSFCPPCRAAYEGGAR